MLLTVLHMLLSGKNWLICSGGDGKQHNQIDHLEFRSRVIRITVKMVLLRKRWLCRGDGFVWFRAALVDCGAVFSILLLVVTVTWNDRWRGKMWCVEGILA
jgi:hypothetical protein